LLLLPAGVAAFLLLSLQASITLITSSATIP
jgi:hypothetical protein